MTTSSEFAKATYCVIVGVGTYTDSRLQALPGPPVNAMQLAAALTSEDGASVAAENVLCLIDTEATSEAVIAAIREQGTRVPYSGRLLVYFAGHGIRESNRDFFLCAHDTNIDSLSTTAISSAGITAALHDSRASGLLVVLDCCRSAGLAESAPSLFATAPKGGYRILLSASQGDEPSWDLPDGTGTIFSALLIGLFLGREIAGRSHGLVYFSELLEHIQNRLTERLAQCRAVMPTQTPMFIGTYSRDPLIVVRPGVTGLNSSVITTRYSREYLRSLARRVAIGFAALVAFAIGTLYSVLASSQYAVIEGERIVVYRGRPGLNAPGFPRREFETDWTTADLMATSSLRASRSLTAPLGANVLPILHTQLKPQARVAAEWLVGRQHESLSTAREVLGHTTDLGSTDAMQLAVMVMHMRDAELVDLIAHVGDAEAAGPAIATAFDFAPSRAASLTRSIPSSDAKAHISILRIMIGTCNPEKRDYIARMLSEVIDTETYAAAIDAGIRVECELSTRQILAALATEARLSDSPIQGSPVVGTIGYYDAIVSNSSHASTVLDQLRTGTQTGPMRTAALRFLAHTQNGISCLDEFRQGLAIGDVRERKAAAFAVAAHCSDAIKIIPDELLSLEFQGRTYPDSELILFMADHGHFPASRLLQMAGVATSTAERMWINYAMSSASCAEVDAVRQYLLQVLERPVGYSPPGVPEQDRVTALIALDLLGTDPRPAANLVHAKFSPSEAPGYVHSVPMEAAVWFGRFYPSELFEQLEPKLGGADNDYVIHALGRSNLGGQQLARLKDRAMSGTSLDQLRALAIYAMKASSEELDALLRDRHVTRRHVTLQYIAANPSAFELSCDIRPNEEFSSQTILNACPLVMWSVAARREITRMPRWAAQWRITRWLYAGGQVSAGLVILFNELGRQQLLAKAPCQSTSPSTSQIQ